MFSFVTALVMLCVGYFVYGRIVEKTFGMDADRKTPCYTRNDGVDYLPMPTWKVFLIQFLNIAGTGPIFGSILGVLFGPAAFIWIVLGCIFAGSVHDYMCGMICIRKDGTSVPEFVGDEMGGFMRHVMRILSLLLLILAGTVFVTTPADLLDTMVENSGFLWSRYFWVLLIFLYYIFATLLPIDKLIGKVYPLFGMALFIMAGGLLYGIFFMDGTVPEVTEAFHDYNPTSTMPLFPALCVTISCGAISGFHATQSPLMARCITNEKHGRAIFYGAMIAEGIIALIWAAASIKFADSLNVAGNTPYEKLVTAMTNPETGKISPSLLVNSICSSWMGIFGSVLAILGVVAAPITSGDTAFRSARLIVADFMKVSQKTFLRRFMLCLPLFAACSCLLFLDFTVLWRYSAWTNQTLATIMLWAATIWMAKQHSGSGWLLTFIPAVFMTFVCTCYIVLAPEGFALDAMIAYVCAGIASIVSAVCFLVWKNKRMSEC